MKQYPAYKDSGIEWIGCIPISWGIVPIRALCYLGRGRVISNEEIGENAGEYPVYSSQTTENGLMGRLNTYDFDGEYVTWTTDGANAGTVFYRYGKFNCTNVCGTLKAKNGKVYLKYLHYILNLGTKCYVRYDINPKLMNNEMAAIRVPLPEYSEQKIIADYLDRKTTQIDDLMTKKEWMIELLKEERAAVINQAVTKGLDPEFMFDTNIFDKVLNEDFRQFSGKVFITHIQRDQIEAMPKEKVAKKEQLLALFHTINANSMPTSVAVWDVSKWDECCWGTDANNKLWQKISKINGAQDALIAVTAINRSLILVTDDKDLLRDVNAEGGGAITFDEFTRGITTELKDSGIEWLGKVPKQWHYKRLKYLDKTIMGQSPESDDCNKDGLGIPFLQGNADFSYLNPIPSVWCERPNKLARKEDVLLSVRAPVGAVNIADQIYGIGRGLCAIRARRSHKKYIFYRTLCLSDELNRIATGSTYTAISVDQVNNVVIPEPEFNEQEKIANYLDYKIAQIDTQIDREKKSIAYLKEYRTALISEAVTGKICLCE